MPPDNLYSKLTEGKQGWEGMLYLSWLVASFSNVLFNDKPYAAYIYLYMKIKWFDCPLLLSLFNINS